MASNWTLPEEQLIMATMIRIRDGHFPTPCDIGDCELCDSVRDLADVLGLRNKSMQARETEIRKEISQRLMAWLDVTKSNEEGYGWIGEV